MNLRHVTSINDLDNDEIEQVFALADRYLDKLKDADHPHRIGTSMDIADGSILASLFYEPSTRTRLSFEAAMIRLGGKAIGSADPATSSAAKGESLADTVRVASNYADVLVIRHPRDGAAKLAAEYADVPIINGGDGAHEHPTQTLCDLFTLRRENKQLKNLNVAVSGDLKGSRTIHSFVYALARFGANIMLMPAKGMELPPHVDWRLRNEYRCRAVPKERYDNAAMDALYVTAKQPHQLSLMAPPDFERTVKLKKGVDVVYVTRFQKERWTEQGQDYPKVDANFLKAAKYRKTSVLHPLPRVGELDASLDHDRRAVYFRQAAYGVPIRMALISLLLDLDKRNGWKKFERGFVESTHVLFDQPIDAGIECINSNCIVHDKLEHDYARSRFHLIEAEPPRLRCFYCERDIDSFIIANRKTRHYETNASARNFPNQKRAKDFVLFADAREAEKAGYTPRMSNRKTAAR
jgi:aspartate carbamoyltransferase catalytic subunit